jgi:hypothetical protein
VNPSIGQLITNNQITGSTGSIGSSNNNNITIQSAFGAGFKCPSSNFLKSANTVISSTTMMT